MENSTNSVFKDNISGAIALVMGFSAFIMVVFLIFVFPCFVVVYRTNKERDKLSAVFPIIEHFYRAICFFYFSLTVCACVFICYAIINRNSEEISFLANIMAPPVMIMIGLMVIFVQAHNFLVAILSIQRFLLFFFPNIKEYIELTGRKGKFLFRSTYSLFYIGHFAFFGWFAYQFENEKVDGLVGFTYMIFYAALNTLLFISAFLYIPIMWRIRKLNNIAQSSQNNPQVYILYQTLSIVVFKMSHSWVIFYNGLGTFPLENYLYFFLIYDFISTPVLVQISYISCNKQNVDILRKKLFIGQSRSFLSSFSRSSRVEPVPHATSEIYQLT